MASQATMATVDNILKEVYVDRVRNQLQSEAITSKRIEKTSDGVSEDAGGKYVRFSIRVARNHGIGARNENEALPAGYSQKYATGQLGLTYQYGSVQLTGQVMNLAETKSQAFASELDQEMSGLKEGLRKDINRQMYGTSKGVLATANAIGSTTTFICSNAQSIYLEVGMVLDLYDNTDALKANGSAKEITNVTKTATTTTVTFTPAATAATAVGDYIVRDDNLNKEITGFGNIVSDTSTLYGINPATVPVWKSVIDNPGSARNLSEGLMINMIDGIRTNGGKTTVIFTSLGVRRSYFQLLAQQRRYNDTVEFEGGFKGLKFTTDTGDIPLISDYDCPPNTAWYINEDEFKIYQMGDWSFMNKDGSQWQRVMGAPSGGGQVLQFDAYLATMYKYWQLATFRRNTHGLMGNINEA